MKTLGLYRHAKSDWNDARARDFDRPLNARGRKGAVAMARHMQAMGFEWDRVIASPAVRVAETIEMGTAELGITIPVNWDRRIYLASSATLLDLIREIEGDPASVLMVGHNPGLEDLIFDLVPDDGSSPLRDLVEEKFPTATLAILEIDVATWSDVEMGLARLTHLMRPRDLDPELGPGLED
jgi:phosphohistidine phosphatase